jgi:hypothetical protein
MFFSMRVIRRAPQVEEYYHAAHQKYVPLHQHFRVPDEVYYKRTETTTEDLPKALTRVCARALPGPLCLPAAQSAAPSKGRRGTEGSSGCVRSSPAKAVAPPRAISASISTVQPTSTRTVRPAPPSQPVRSVQGESLSCARSCLTGPLATGCHDSAVGIPQAVGPHRQLAARARATLSYLLPSEAHHHSRACRARA